MKKALTLLALLLISVGAMAQLNVTSQRENTIEKITQELFYNTSDSAYYIALTTSNQFDDYMMFKLGKGKESALQTIDDLLAFMEQGEKGDVISVENGFGKEYRIYVYDHLNLNMASDYHAGTRIIQKPRINRWRRLISEY
jgi:putative component of toxin-antitoxin plasmid stabilization module